GNSGTFSPQRQTTEAKPANSELAEIGPRPSADLAAVVPARGKLGPRPFSPCVVKLLLDLRVLDSFCCRCQNLLLNFLCSDRPSARPPDQGPGVYKIFLRPERHSQMLEQRARLLVGRSRGHDGDVHALQLVHLGVINLGKNQLVAQTQRVVAASIKG